LCGCLCFRSFIICDDRVLNGSRWWCWYGREIYLLKLLTKLYQN